MWLTEARVGIRNWIRLFPAGRVRYLRESVRCPLCVPVEVNTVRVLYNDHLWEFKKYLSLKESS